MTDLSNQPKLAPRQTVNKVRFVTAASLFDGHDAWAPMAIADGRLLLRDANKMYCVNVSQ